MKAKRRNQLLCLIAIVTGVGIAMGLALYALRQNISLYYTPSQLENYSVPFKRYIRIGGMVKKGSVHHDGNTLHRTFVITDFVHDVTVSYTGVLPALFREGQGIVVQGRLNAQSILMADQVLAKHDAKYVPPMIKQKKV